MAKKVFLGPKPQPNPRSKGANADDWVNGRLQPNDSFFDAGSGASPPKTAPQTPPMKRLTIDVPEVLHAQIKARCALKGVKMADEIRALLEKHLLNHDES